MQQVEAFVAEGVVSGSVTIDDGMRGGLDPAPPVEVDRATWYPIAGGAAERRARFQLESDDLLVLCTTSEDLPIHASWHSVALDLGPYRVSGELPTLPGFDPGRALARPGGMFLLLRDVRVELTGHPESGSVERPHAFVNRYAVERVAADIDLGYFFPGARFLTTSGRPMG